MSGTGNIHISGNGANGDPAGDGVVVTIEKKTQVLWH
jgi:hypothetical protein